MPQPSMNPPRIYVDFNEMPSQSEVLLAKGDAAVDSAGNSISLTEGMEVSVYSEDCDEIGRQDNLIAEGIVVRNGHGGWTSAAKWLLKIDARGVRHESDERSGPA